MKNLFFYLTGKRLIFIYLLIMIKIGYKKCYPIDNKNDRVIGVFEIPDDAKIQPISHTNTFAKYRVNKCRLIRVESIDHRILKIDKIAPVIFFAKDPEMIYTINELVEIDNFDDTDTMVDIGIRMFFERIRAEYYLVEHKENGQVIIWRDNGLKYSEENFLNNLKDGLAEYYHPNGNIKERTVYNLGHKRSFEYLYDINGKLVKTIDHSPVFNYIDTYKT